MLKGKKVNEYPKTFKSKGSQAGVLGFMYVYELVGTEAEIEGYLAAQEQENREPQFAENGNPLFWSPNGSGDDVIEVIVSERSGKTFENNIQKTELSKAFIDAARLSPAAEQAIATEYARHKITEVFAARRKLTITMNKQDDAAAEKLAAELAIKDAADKIAADEQLAKNEQLASGSNP